MLCATLATPPNVDGVAPLVAAPTDAAEPNAGADAGWPNIEVEDPVPAEAGDATAAPNVLVPKVGVELAVPLPPNLPNVGVALVAGLPNIGLVTVDAAAAGDPKAGLLAAVLLAAPKLNAELEGSAGFAGAVAELTAPPKLKPEEPVLVAPPKIELVAAAVAEELAAPNEPNVTGFSAVVLDAVDVAMAPKVGTTLLAPWPLCPNTKLEEPVVLVLLLLVPRPVGFVSVDLDPKLKLGATVAVDVAVVALLVVVDPAGEPKLNPGVIDGAFGF